MTKKNIKQFFLKMFFLFSMILPVIFMPINAVKVLAQSDTPQASGWWGAVQDGGLEQVGEAYGGDTPQDIRIIITNIIRVVLGFLGIIALILILYAGFKWLTSAGNEDQIADAKKILMAGVVGLIIILSSFALATFVLNRIIEATTGIPVPN